jgi:hypothetical protein
MTNRRLLPVAVLLLLALPLLGDTFPNGGPRTTDNDDGCDIANLPAATLLLPYFEVDLDDFEGETTLFTVTNVGDRARVVRVTLWTDYGFPIVSFNVYLTGYDVQSINIRDVLASGRIGADEGTGTSVSPIGELSRTAGAGYNLANCTRIPHLSPEMVARLQDAFTLGRIALPSGMCTVGNAHVNAIGYATMDVVSQCTDVMPIDRSYYTEDLRYENVLMGEYQQLNPGQAYAQGGAMVHIRAVPEGGTERGLTTNFPRTFYERLTFSSGEDTPTDGRQPLPSSFVARWINGTGAAFETSFKIWRELSLHDLTGCGADDDALSVAEIVVFDEAENAVTQARPPAGDPPRPAVPGNLPAAALVNVSDDDFFPRLPNGATAGWVYLNLDSRDPEATHAEQAWVISSMRAEGRYSVDMDATGLGNGCSPRNDESEITEGTKVIGPSPNVTP